MHQDSSQYIHELDTHELDVVLECNIIHSTECWLLGGFLLCFVISYGGSGLVVQT